MKRFSFLDDEAHQQQQNKRHKHLKEMVSILPSGQKMPLVGLGTWKIPKNVCAANVHFAIKKGYRLLDCACDYGNEKEVGQGIKAAIDEGIVERKDLFITSKLWNTYHAKEHVLPACKKTLSDLGLDYLDLYLIHFPISLKYVDFETRYPPEWAYDPSVKNNNPLGCEFVKVPYSETWSGMEELVKAGLTKNIGVANLNCQLLMEVLAFSKIPPAVLQIEYHLELQQPQLISFAQRNGISVTGFSTFGGTSYRELGNPVAKKIVSLFERRVVRKMSAKHGKTPAQVLLRFAIQNKIAVIPKTINDKRLIENQDIFDFKLDSDDMRSLKHFGFGKRVRFNDPGAFADYPIYG